MFSCQWNLPKTKTSVNNTSCTPWGINTHGIKNLIVERKREYCILDLNKYIHNWLHNKHKCKNIVYEMYQFLQTTNTIIRTWISLLTHTYPRDTGIQWYEQTGMDKSTTIFTTETVDSLAVEICIFFTKVTVNSLSDPSYLSVNECFLNRYYYTVFPYTVQILSCGFIYVQNNICIQKSGFVSTVCWRNRK